MAAETKPVQLAVHALVFRGEEHWVAQCLEYDVAHQGSTIEEALLHLARTLTAYMVLDTNEGRAPLSGVERAPMEFWTKYMESKLRLTWTAPTPSPSPRFEDIAIAA